MAFKGITINTAAESAGHIYAEDDAAIFQSIFGSDGVLNIGNCLKATVISNNKVRISDGVLCVGGHIGRTKYSDYQDMTIENGASGYKRNDIIYARFLTSGSVDTYTLVVKKGTATTGTATDPATTAGNLYQGATERDYPLYRVKLSGLSISAVEKLFTVIPTIPELKSQMEQEIKTVNQSLGDLNGSIKTIWIESGKSYSFDIGKSGALIFCPRGEWGVMTDYYSPSWTTLKGTIYQNFTIAKTTNSYKVIITNKTDFTAMLLIINSGEPK